MAEVKGGTIDLRDGNAIPALGMGFWLVEDADAPRVVAETLAAGYRLLDTASMYGNEAGIGTGLQQVDTPRKEIFVTTKLGNDAHGYDKTMRAFDDSMAKLKLDYLDLYLIHWPLAGSEKYIDSWKAFIELQKAGRIKSIGVSNFLDYHIRRLIDETGVAPVINQIEYHPYFQQPELAARNREFGVVTEAWAPLGRGGALTDAKIGKIASKYGKSPAQIIIRWHLDKGFVVIPKSSNPQRMRENIDVFNFKLTDEETAMLDSMHNGVRTGDDPATFAG
ncbi:MAG: aldo/keto reductase [Planctomycetes bacterium]|nr:aldo/keto reductase [Planctomycetota bacterium]